MKYNYLGDDISDVKVKLADDSFGSYDINGKINVNWQTESLELDMYGFDKRNTFEDGEYIREIELQKGTVLCRYGSQYGFFTTVVGTPYEELGLPYLKETIEYHEYVVVADSINVRLFVTEGVVYPMFNSRGGAVQYLHSQPINKELEDKKIEEVFSWIKQKRNCV